MEVDQLSNNSAGPSRSYVQNGHLILLRLPSGEVKSVKIQKDSTISLGKYGSFQSQALIGHPYGLSYEIMDKTLEILPPKTLDDAEDSNATNEQINDGFVVQPLTTIEIEALKQSGVHASEIIRRQIEVHANYSMKTAYSKEKYKKRKERKFAKTFTTIEPTLHNVCDFWFNKDRSRIQEMRPDTLAQLLTLGNVRPGGRYVVVDDASGLLISAVLERLSGRGRIISVCDVESPPAYPIIAHMNFSDDIVKPVLSSLNWATADEEYSLILPPTDLESGTARSERQKARLEQRKRARGGLTSTREELFAGEFDGLFVASDYEPFSIIEKLAPYVSGSASIVAHNPYLQVLTEAQANMKAVPGYLGPSITESWLRQYQILPGRTHPEMNMTGTGGYLLHVIKTYNDPTANAVPITHNRKKKKIEELNPSE